MNMKSTFRKALFDLGIERAINNGWGGLTIGRFWIYLVLPGSPHNHQQKLSTTQKLLIKR